MDPPIAGMSGPSSIDVRHVALPCIFVAAFFQYMHFAKKPVAVPCQRVTERCARRCVFVGLLAEFASLRLLPLCALYPMNSSCVVFLYFWRESKRFRSLQIREIFACASTLSAWVLPFVAPMEGQMPLTLEVTALLNIVLAPETCLYIVVLLLAGVVLHCSDRGGSALWSCSSPALNFGVSVIFLKSFIHITSAIAGEPNEPTLWVLLIADLALVFFGADSCCSATSSCFGNA